MSLPSSINAGHDTRLSPSVIVALLVLGTLIVNMYYFWTLDYAWFSDYLVQSLPAALRAQLPGPIEVGRQAILLPGTLVATLKPILGLCGLTLYAMIVVRALRRDVSFSEMFRYVVAIALPFVLGLLLQAFQLLRSHGQIAPEDLDLTTLNALFVHATPGTVAYRMSTALSLTCMCSAGIFAVILHRQLRGNVVRDAAIAFAPYILTVVPAVVLTAIS